MKTRRDVLAAAPLGAISLLASCAVSKDLSQSSQVETDPRVAGERRAEDLSPAMHAVFDGQRQSILRTMDEQRIPGLSISCVDRQRILWQAGFGVADSRTGVRVTPRTIFSLQSISKNFTATAIQLAVEDGILDLDAPIGSYLPDFRINSRFEANPLDRITLRLLLSHRAGFTHEAPIGSNFSTSPSFDAHVLSIQETWLRSPVGSRYDYSNLGIDLAAYVLQRAARMPFERLMQESLLAPLGMTRSFVDTPTRNGAQAGCARGHSEGFNSFPDYIPLTASGGVRVSAEDGARYIQFHLNRGRVGKRSILAPEWLDEMYRPASRLPEGYYGLGTVSYVFNDTYLLGHSGGGFGFSALMLWAPKFGLGALLLTNNAATGNHNSRIVGGLLEALSKLSTEDWPAAPGEDFFAHVPPAPQSAESPATLYRAEWASYLGKYRPIYSAGFAPTPEWLDGLAGAVYEQDGFMWIRSAGETERLAEHLPGLFFGTLSGEATDFRGSTPRWRNIALQKIE